MSLEIGHFDGVWSLPVTLEDAAGVAAVGIEAPEGPTDPLLPHGDFAHSAEQEIPIHVSEQILHPGLIADCLQRAAEFPHEHRGLLVLEDVAPVGVPDGRKVGGVVGGREPGLIVDTGRVVMWGVDHLIRHIECHWIGSRSSQIAPIPVRASVVVLDPLHDNEQMGVDRQDGIAAAFRGLVPVGGG